MFLLLVEPLLVLFLPVVHSSYPVVVVVVQYLWRWERDQLDRGQVLGDDVPSRRGSITRAVALK